jgi:hypothetical protein
VSVSADDLETLATQPASASGDAGSVTSRPAEDVIRLAGAAAGQTAVAGTNAQGGPRSLWNRLRPARILPRDPL